MRRDWRRAGGAEQLSALSRRDELLDERQARLALALQPPRPSAEDTTRPIEALSERQYERKVGEAERLAAREPLLGWRHVAILRVLGECGLRAEELVRLERRHVPASTRHGSGFGRPASAMDDTEERAQRPGDRWAASATRPRGRARDGTSMAR